MSTTEREFFLSDGVPNVFVIRRDVIEIVGMFDEELIQTYTEPDYSFSAKCKGYMTAVYPKAKTLHLISKHDNYTTRALGGKFVQKAYCLMRNRTVLVRRYGSTMQKCVYILFFSWFWPLVYTILVLESGNGRTLIKLYWRGWYDGVMYFFTGKLRKSI